MRSSENADGHGDAIKATVSRYEDRPDECTLHPADPDTEKRTTEWLSAKRGTYVSLFVWR